MDTILYFSSLNTPDIQETLSGMQHVLVKRGIHLQFVERDPAPGLVGELVRLWNPIGIVAYGPDVDASCFDALPAVLLCHDPRTLPPDALSVTHASDRTGRTAAQELLATGCRSFAFVHNPEPKYWSEIRCRAFAETIHLHGFRCKTMAPQRGPKENAAEWQRRLRDFLAALPKPCGLFAACDRVASEVIAAARFEEIAVPDELAVLGVDNDESVCERIMPTLSSIQPDFRNAGMLAARLLLETRDGRAQDKSTGNGGETRRVLEFWDLRVVRRASTKLLAMRDARVADALEYIRREACAGLRAGSVVELFGTTRRIADLRFQRATGRTIAEEIRAVQLEECKRLLVGGSHQIKVICDFCGFATEGSLRKFFRRETGMSMRQWRALNGRNKGFSP